MVADAPTPRRRGPLTAAARAALVAKQREAEARFAAIAAAMPPIAPEDLSEDGCINLIGAFWGSVRHDLACKSHATRAWVESSDGFLRWCDISGQDPDTLRDFLLGTVWGNDAHRRGHGWGQG